MENQLHETFPTVFGRNLIGELPNFVRPPFVVATMEDLWPMFASEFDGADCKPLIVRSVERTQLDSYVDEFREHAAAVVGIGGGMALDGAKYLAWQLNLPLFQVPTALSTNAAFGQRCGIREGKTVLYRGWAVPQAVYIDYGILQAAPRHLNLSGICEILCLHTGVLDWKYATEQGKCEAKWPYDDKLAQMSLRHVDTLLAHLEDIREMNETGIKTLVGGLQWGSSFHGAGWCPRHIEGVDHFVFYALEDLTGIQFLHGQPVCLGIVVGCMMHQSKAKEMLAAIVKTGLDIRPEAMGMSWEQVETALLGLRDYVHEKGLWHSIAHDVQLDTDFVAQLRTLIDDAYA